MRDVLDQLLHLLPRSPAERHPASSPADSHPGTTTRLPTPHPHMQTHTRTEGRKRAMCSIACGTSTQSSDAMTNWDTPAGIFLPSLRYVGPRTEKGAACVGRMSGNDWLTGTTGWDNWRCHSLSGCPHLRQQPPTAPTAQRCQQPPTTSTAQHHRHSVRSTRTNRHPQHSTAAAARTARTRPGSCTGDQNLPSSVASAFVAATSRTVTPAPASSASPCASSGTASAQRAGDGGVA